MWRFKASKYKNTAPKIPKKEEWVTGINIGSLLPCCGNHIKASTEYMVFNVESGGGSNLGILHLGDVGKKQQTTLPLLRAHREFVTDFAFAPWNDLLLATGSTDTVVNLWELPAELGEDQIIPKCTLTQEERRIENVLWHPLAEGILAVSTFKTLKVFDVNTQTAVYILSEHGDQIQGMSWKADGSQVVTACKDKMIRILDPRSSSIVIEAQGHDNSKDSRVVWMGDQDLILTTGYDNMRQREVCLRDTRNLSAPLKSITDGSSGALLPLYDADTRMCFLSGKGDTMIKYVEISDKDPFIIENANDMVEQIRGMALVPKRAVDVMTGEANRLLLLSQNAIIPISYVVPRKNYSDFHADLFPDTFCGKSSMTTAEWQSGLNTPGEEMSLNPSSRGTISPPKISVAVPSTPSMPSTNGNNSTPDIPPKPVIPALCEIPEKTPTPQGSPGSVLRRWKPPVEEASSPNYIAPPPRVARQVRQSRAMSALGHQAKYRHLKGTPLHKSLCFDNLRKLSRGMPGESDGFHINRTYMAVPLDGPGGVIGIIKMSEPGRLPDTGLPAVENGGKVTDFVWDPFDDHRLIVACDDAKIRVWRIPESMDGRLQTPEFILSGHTEKVMFVRCHPLARDVLVSSSYDKTVKLWDLDQQNEMLELKDHSDAVLSLAWNSDGKKCATVCKDGKIRIFEPRTSPSAIKEGTAPASSRGARVVWVCEDKCLAVSGFDKMSTRGVYMYDVENLSEPVSYVDVDTTPSILIPYYDPDGRTLFLTGKGDRTVHAYELNPCEPYIFPLSHYQGVGLHQALSFLPKCVCDIKKVEFARAYRLTANTIGPISFTVPRVKMEYFQDDLFPDTAVTWESVMSSKQWYAGEDEPVKRVSLCPSDMSPLSSAPTEEPKASKYSLAQSSYTTYREENKTDDEKKGELLSAMTKKMGVHDDPLPQDLTEGVEEDEWED